MIVVYEYNHYEEYHYNDFYCVRNGKGVTTVIETITLFSVTVVWCHP